MKNLSKILCSKSDASDVKEPSSLRRAKPRSREASKSRLKKPLEQPYLTGLNMEVLRVRKHGNAYFVAETRFLRDGGAHNVRIGFDGESGTKMELQVDGEALCEVDTEQETQGNAELSFDEKVIDFVWDVGQTPNIFSFYTRRKFSAYESEAESGICSYKNKEYRTDCQPKHWEENVHVYLLRIMGD